MRKFISKVSTFILGILLVLLFGTLMPTTPRASESLLFSYENKIERLDCLEGPRLIFLGGSNLSFGLDCQIIEDSLDLKPINLGLHASLGLRFIMDSSEEFVKAGDIVVFAPEYVHFYKNLNRGSEELLRMGLDVDRKYFNYLNVIQIYNCLEFFPAYVLSKFKPKEYGSFSKSKYHSVNSFNSYGDAVAHWPDDSKEFVPFGEINGELNSDVIEYLREYTLRMREKGVKVFISFPAYQKTSYANSIHQIKSLENRLISDGFNVIGSTERFCFSDTLFFNTPYHLNRSGVTLRTNFLIEDLKTIN